MEKIKSRKYTKELLDDTIKRDNAILINNNIKLNSKAKIPFICNCGNKDIKQFCCLVFNGGAF